MKKASKLVMGSAILAAVALPVSAYAASVTGTAKISPKSGISLNFDSFSFDGSVGQKDLVATYSNQGTNVGAAEFMVKSKVNYGVFVSGSDFTDGTNTFDIERLKVAAGGAAVAVTSNPNSVYTGNANATQGITYTLDLTTEGTNGYSDNTLLDNLDADATVTTNVTIAYTVL